MFAPSFGESEAYAVAVRFARCIIAYELALQAADDAWDAGDLDFTAVEAYLAPLVQAQLEDL